MILFEIGFMIYAFSMAVMINYLAYEAFKRCSILIFFPVVGFDILLIATLIAWLKDIKNRKG